MKKIERISANEYSDLEELASMVYHNEWALVWEKDLDALESTLKKAEVEKEFAYNMLHNILTDITYCADRNYKFKTDVLAKIEKNIKDFLKAGKE